MSVRVLFKWVEVEESGFVGDGVLAILPLSAKNLAHDTSEAETCCLMYQFYPTNILNKFYPFLLGESKTMGSLRLIFILSLRQS